MIGVPGEMAYMRTKENMVRVHASARSVLVAFASLVAALGLASTERQSAPSSGVQRDSEETPLLRKITATETHTRKADTSCGNDDVSNE